MEFTLASMVTADDAAPTAEQPPPERLIANRAMDRYADGDTASFSTLYDVLSPRLYAFIYRQTRDQNGTEDLVQQTLLKLHCARSSFARGGEVFPWAFSIARRLLIDAYRRGRYTETLLDDEAERDERPSGDAPADQVIESKQTAHRLERALMKLPETQRIAFQLVRQEGLSLAEAAAVLRTTPNAVKLRAHRTEEALRLALIDKEHKR